MKKFFKIFIPILLALTIVFCLLWYLFVYDRGFTRDVLLSSARAFDRNNNPAIAAWFYDLAYNQSVDSDEVAIELAQQHKADGNFTQAEVILSKAIEDGGSTDLYVALSRTYVEQDKLMDAVKLLNGITNPDILSDMEALRPAAPTVSPDPGFYNKYISITVSGEGGKLFVGLNGEYPSIYDKPYADPIVLGDGENTLYCVIVSDEGVVSPLAIYGYTVGGIIEEVVFTDPAVEKSVREILNVDADVTLMSNQLWDITSFTMPAEATSYADLKYLAFLEELEITSGPSDQLSVLSSLTNLIRLRISDTIISEAELEGIGTLSRLQELTLTDCGLSTAAPLENLTALTYLDLSSNAIRNIQPLEKLTQLTQLHLEHNVLTDLNSLSQLNALTKLDLSYNAITSLAPISNLSALTWLDVSHNSIQNLTGVESLSKLQFLGAGSNAISDISQISSCSELTYLNVSNNSISDIAAVESLTKITELNFSHNQVVQLPSFAEDCALITIDGSHNMLLDLSPLSNVHALNNVYMDYNEEISTIDCLSNCHNLILVNVYGTAVTEVKDLTDRSIIVNFNPVQ